MQSIPGVPKCLGPNVTTLVCCERSRAMNTLKSWDAHLFMGYPSVIWRGLCDIHFNKGKATHLAFALLHP